MASERGSSIAALAFALGACCLAIPAPGQEIASVDLWHPSAGIPTLDGNHAACKDLHGAGVKDGFILREDGKLEKIRVELVSFRDKKLVIGTELDAIVRFKTIGDRLVKIPWSKMYPDNDGQDPDNRSWEAGLFELKLTSKRNSEVELRNLSQVLLASETVAGSTLTLKPGEWISAQIKFRVDALHPGYEKLKEGESELFVEWFQTVRIYEVNDCGFTLGYYPYRDYYKQENPAVRVKVVAGAPDKTQQPTHDLKQNR